jgi:hypothetical protein
VNQGVQGSSEDLGPGSPTIVIDPQAWCGVARTLVRGTWRPPSYVEKLLSGGGIKVTNRALRVPKWRAFVANRAVLLGETW